MLCREQNKDSKYEIIVGARTMMVAFPVSVTGLKSPEQHRAAQTEASGPEHWAEGGAGTASAEQRRWAAWRGRGFNACETRLPLPGCLLSVTSNIRTVHIRHLSAASQTEKSFSKSQEPEM